MKNITGHDIIIYLREINIKGLSEEAKNRLIRNLTEYRKLNSTVNFSINNDRIVYDTEVLIPVRKRPGRINLLLVFGNPSVHSTEEGMFFSYEKTGKSDRWREHRAWKALKECGLLELKESKKFDIHRPNPGNIKAINDFKRHCLLNAEYKSPFNVFMLPYFSFSTPASGKYNGVAGIKKLFGAEVFSYMEESEFQRFKNIILKHKIKYVVSFQKSAFDGICRRMKRGKTVLSENSLKRIPFKLIVGHIDIGSGRIHEILLYQAPSTRLLLGKKNKETLLSIANSITRGVPL